jgi:hypothetical protein
VKAGKFIPDNPAVFRKAFYLHDGKQVQLSVTRKREKRSSNQNKYYWGVVLPLIAQTTGYTIDESHDAMKMQFLVKRTAKVPTTRSTTDLSTAEMEEYLENIRRFAAVELSCYVPIPNEAQDMVFLS